MTSKILIVLHQERSSPGRVGQLLAAHGHRLDIRRPPLGDPLPATLAEHAGAVVFGGPMSANDEHDYIRREIDWMAVPLREEKPLLGICLGAQLLARHLGQRVGRASCGSVEVGYYPIHATPAAARLSRACGAKLPSHVYQWHSEGFSLPRGAALLATGGGAYPVQMFGYDHAVGVQFHPEMTYAMMCRWLVRGAHRLRDPGARKPVDHYQGWFEHNASVNRWLDGFLRIWSSGAKLDVCCP